MPVLHKTKKKYLSGIFSSTMGGKMYQFGMTSRALLEESGESKGKTGQNMGMG